jgi:outer membrane receptor protein involved in Fe transport
MRRWPLLLLLASAPAVADDDTSTTASTTDQELLEMAQQETIEIYDERPDKPFDRDTEVRLTGEELAARGAVDLGSALALLPDVSVREAGRGGVNIDIRGARKGAVSILIDGVLVSDPYYGTFDVSTIPITDIVQIRVATTPQSPIDGPGGPGGVIEVLTRDAIGPQLVVARVTGDSLPSFGMTGSARVALARHLALRVSGSGLAGARDLELPGNAAVGEGRRAATGAARLEYRRGSRRVAVDGFLDDRHYVAPPSDVMLSTILMIDRETSTRGTIKADDKIGTLQLQAEGFAHYLHRRSLYFLDPALVNETQFEDLTATRVGGSLLATQPIAKEFRWAAAMAIDHERASVESANEPSIGDVTMLEPAADVQYEHRRFRGDLAAGVAIPVGVGADPWPEAKLVGKYRPVQQLELTATAGHKGRLPSLRERFDAATGNPALGPEKAWHAELRAVAQPDEGIRAEVAPFYRHTTGTARVSIDTGMLENLGKLDVYGLDVSGRYAITSALTAGAGYEYVKARAFDPASDMTTADPLDRLPHHRAEGWVQGAPLPWLVALARVRYTGRAIDKAQPTEAYTLVEASLSAQLTKAYLGVLRIDDAFDVRPETRAGYHAPGRVVSIVLQGSWE